MAWGCKLQRVIGERQIADNIGLPFGSPSGCTSLSASSSNPSPRTASFARTQTAPRSVSAVTMDLGSPLARRRIRLLGIRTSRGKFLILQFLLRYVDATLRFGSATPANGDRHT